APFFVVLIDSNEGSGTFTFTEAWMKADGTLVRKSGGRFGTTTNLGKAATGATFSTDNPALCRPADLTGGLLWELYPLPSNAPAPTVSAWKQPVRAATTAALPACTYSNGSSGVGATLTGNSNGALPAQDGVTLSANQDLLVKDQSTASQNGIY